MNKNQIPNEYIKIKNQIPNEQKSNIKRQKIKYQMKKLSNIK